MWVLAQEFVPEVEQEIWDWLFENTECVERIPDDFSDGPGNEQKWDSNAEAGLKIIWFSTLFKKENVQLSTSEELARREQHEK